MLTEVYTVRLGILDTRAWSAQEILNLYKTDLKAAGFSTSQLPSVAYPQVATKVTQNDPFQGAKSITISAPDLGEFSQTRDTRVPYAEDPAKLAESGRAVASVFTWNLCAPLVPLQASTVPASAPGGDPSGTLRDLFRRVKPDVGTLKTSPKVGTFAVSPEILAGYPPKQVRPDCVPAPAPAGGGAGSVPLWQKVLLGALGLYVAKKSHFL